jgi:hypothetical protein
MSTSEPKENNIEKNTRNPTVQQICDLIYPYCPRVCQFIVMKARYAPMTPKIMPEAPALMVVVLLQRTDKMLPKVITNTYLRQQPRTEYPPVIWDGKSFIVSTIET